VRLTLNYMKTNSHTRLKTNVNYDETYRIGLEHGKVERSNLEANIAFLENLSLLSKTQKILEIGCGAGSLNNHFCNKGFDIIGIDISQVALEKAKQLYGNLSLYQMSGDKLEFPDDSFDIVLSFDVFEHIPNIDKHLDEVYRVLKNHGYYLFQTPNKYTSLPYSIFKDKNLSYRAYHPSLQSLFSLKKIMRKHRFTVKIIKQPVFTDFMKAKLQTQFGKSIVNLISRMKWNRIPMLLFPSFYVIAAKTECH
jgi:ubiquinone/menaquinone biosynthesis C-methylase UbiE